MGALQVVPPQPSPSTPSATTTYARVMSTTVPTTTTKLGRAGRKELVGVGDTDELEENEEEEPLPSKSELEWMILKYLQPIHRQLADLHSRLATVEEKLGAGQRGDEDGSSSSSSR